MSAAPISALSLADLAQVCRVGRVRDAQPSFQSTGFADLDAALPFGGWPIGAVTEIMPSTEGIGELQLMMPALARLTREQRHLAFIAPPHLLYPPALAQAGVALERALLVSAVSPTDSLWAAEQCLRCAAFGAVLLWPQNIHDKALRRLQLAAEAGNNLAIVYRSSAAALSSSPAALRLCLHAQGDAMRIEIKKCRGGRAGRMVRLAAPCKLGADDIPQAAPAVAPAIA